MKNVFLRLLLFSFFYFCWYTGKVNSMNTRSIENFTSLPSGSSYFIFRSPWDILPCIFALFFLKQFPKIRRSVLHKIKIDLLYFRDVYDINLGEKNFGRGRAYLFSCRTNFIILRKRQWTQMMTKKTQARHLNQ